MTKKDEVFDATIIEAQVDLICDVQFALQERIVKAGITRRELAQRSGLSTRKISNTMKAEGDPELSEVALLFAHLNASLKVKPTTLRRSHRKA